MKREDGILQLQPRDVDIFVGLLECRVMTLKHTSGLYFDEHGEAAKKRMRKLAHAGYVRARSRSASDPLLYALARRGFDVLHERGTLTNYPPMGWTALEKRLRVSPLTLHHELAVLDVRTSIAVGARRDTRIQLLEFQTWPAMYQFKTQSPSPSGYGKKEIILKPDGFFRLNNAQTGKDSMFFLEVDRSTESLDILMRKIECYVDYYRSGGFAVRNGGTREAYKRHPFRVLMIFQSDERLNTFSQRLQSQMSTIRTFVVSTTLRELATDPLRIAHA